jgi:hypothetical protein
MYEKKMVSKARILIWKLWNKIMLTQNRNSYGKSMCYKFEITKLAKPPAYIRYEIFAYIFNQESG